MSKFIEYQNWRYATKKFDSSKKVSESDLNILKEAIRLSTSSYGLQPYKVLIVDNPEIRERLKPASWNQSQITDASHLFVFANYSHLDETVIDDFIKRVSFVREVPQEHLAGYSAFMKSKILELSTTEQSIWTSKQTYLALGNLLNAAAELKIDVTPMEGFEAEKYNEILNLNSQNLNASLVATIGYRHEEDLTQHDKKVRKSNEELFINI
ncbi:NAD(P)H-dependent oxidoreductase [Flavobacterium columnare]|uniref:NAD(P)H-dependent oxidoreductase n=1 Tax=Flavobacterium columnare TaxID=996 RepID=UPI0007F9D0F0|nr:NAD(P)H-dependent oxidoreductase [Flavobacterium columnare]ANO49216.1 Nitroreductase [Flavobacterium columnare]APT22792.1 NAD(P)H-dependent oxidoreductase [Flavobacterium columnare]QOG91034.1 NAD(P)H-dependent oxidoreductase [Flavobacterium columnare]QOG93688.1 NAD(P)H-dependent oxidoreductase [Flavobacterium columnare]QOG96355.1 NAD(P)H-dependent oxidoreductase [Flavobacterium columnare]